MSIQVHRVRRQRWSIRAETSEQALAIRHWLHENAAGSISDALAAAFDAAAPGNETVRLARIEVTLRVRRIEDVLDSLPPRVADAIGARMTHLDTSPAAWAEDDDATLVEYALTGRVPWPSRPDDSRVVFRLAVRASAPAVVAAIVRRAPDAATLGDAMFRLLQLVDESQWEPLLDALALESPWPAPAPRLPDPTAGRSPASRDRRLRLAVSRVGGLRGDGTAANAPGPAAPTAIAGGQALDQGASTTSRRVSDSTLGSRGSSPLRKSSPDPVKPRPAASFVLPGPLNDSNADTELDFATAVPHAGLVLIHPFLPQLFLAAGFEAVRRWDPSAPSTTRAAALLHFAATGDEEPYELQLGMIKLLLGLAPETPLPVAGGLLNDTDRDEALGMLTAAVGHWKALRRSSVAALRSSFLCRPGLVRRDDNGWRLYVEPASVDVLIARIPWSVSLVKLPWMPIPIHVDWTTR